MNWSQLAVGDLVFGKDQRTWKITKFTKVSDILCQVTLERDRREPFTITTSGDVEVVWTAAQDAERAEALLQVTLGAQPVGRSGPDGVHLTPAAFREPGSLLAHAYIFHGVTGDGMASLEALTLWHDELHANPAGMTAHHHDPDFYKANR
jgi:hypothetical protein